MNRAARVVVVGTLDTKGEEIAYLRELLLRRSIAVEVVDVGVLGKPQGQADVPRTTIAQLAGTSIEELTKREDRGAAILAMHQGICAWVKGQDNREILGVLAIGGSAGTAIASAAMRELPVGTPKVLVSTMASGDTRPYVGTSDMTMMYSVGDFTGLNRLTRSILANAAGAMAGMVEMRRDVGADESRNHSAMVLAGATMFGVTTPCVREVQRLLSEQGFELLVFHATGTGGQAMEKLVTDGFLEAVVDITTTELADELVGGVLTAGPHRMEAAAQAGVPQVVSVGAMDMVNFGPPETVPQKFAERLFYPHNPSVTLMRTTASENVELGRILALKLNAARGPVKLLLPLGGVSALDAPGRTFYDRNADAALFGAIRKNLSPNVELIELDMHINDPEFAAQVAEALLAAVAEKRQGNFQSKAAGEQR